MGISKSLIGSVIGAAVAIGIHYAIKQSTGESYIWFPMVVGLIVGIASRVVAGGSLSSGSRVTAGALAAIVAGVAIFTPDFLNSFSGSAEYGPIEDKDRLVNASIDKSDDKDDSGSAADKGSDSKTTQGDSEPADREGSDNKDAGSENKDAGADKNDTGSDAKDPETSTPDEATSTEAKDETQTSDSETSDGNDQAVDSPDAVANSRSAGMNQQFAERGKSDPSAEPSDANMEKFAELINKKKHESWMETFLPIVFSGIGMVLAYIIGQSGSSNLTSKE